MAYADSRIADSTQGVAIASRRSAAAWLVAISAVIAIGLALAPAASADYGVIGKYGFRNAPGELRHAPGEMFDLRAVGINFDGTGGAAPGDLYVQDSGGFTCCGGGGGHWGVRLQQFSESGGFKRLWGVDTIANGPNNADETQAVRVRATGGSYKLTFNGQTTGAINYDATAGTVESQLEGLASISGAGSSVSVSGGPGDALGASPYLVTFEGTAGGIDLASMTADGSALTGGAATASVVTTNPGGVGFEVCTPAQGDVCQKAPRGTGDGKQNIFVGGGLGDATTVEVDQTTGAVYSAGFNRVTKFSPTGKFLRAFGYDVVRSGPDDSNTDERQRVRVIATGGTFALSMNFFYEGGGFRTTDQIPYDAPASAPPNPGTAGPDSVEEALNDTLAAIPSLKGVSDHVTVTGGPGPTPYIVDFGGSLGGDDFLQIEGSTANLIGAPKAVIVDTLVQGGGPEVCTADDLCKPGLDSGAGGSVATDLGEFTPGNNLAVAPAGTANEGNVMLTEADRNRVSEFTEDGDFVRMFGWDVVAAGTDDSSADEQQQIELNAGTTGGKFSLTFNGVTTGASGAGNVTEGSNTITSVITTNGAFAEGQILSAPGIPAEATITSVGANSLTLSANGTSTGTNLGLVADNIDYSASAAQVETALNALPTIGGAGGSVSVSGGPGTVNPFLITFGGTLGGDNLAQMTASTEGLAGEKTVTVTTPTDGGTFEVCTSAAGSTCKPGQGGTGVGQFTNLGDVAENSAGDIYTVERAGGRRVQKFTPQAGPPELLPAAWGSAGAPNGAADADAPVDLGIGPGDDVLVAKKFLPGAATCDDGSSSPAEERVQILSPDGLTLDETGNPCSGIEAEGFFFVQQQEFEVNPATGTGYLTASFNLPDADDHIFVFGETGGPAELTVDPPSNISGTGATISGTVDPNGPGTVPYPNPAYTKYRIEFKKVSDAAWQVFSPDVSLGGGSSPVPFSVGVNGLEPKTEYEARAVATKPYGFAPLVETTTPFTTLGAPPVIDAFSSDNVTATSADLKALINPRGTETTYHFEYGTTPSYGSSTPEQPVGSQLAAQPVQVHIEGLQSAVYHFRVVATSSEGTFTSTDQTFNFYPESCPNDTVRQQTGSGSLPDCRAYELVSPANAGAAILRAGGPSAAHASHPARFAFHGLLGSIPGPWNIPTGLNENTYVSTRTPVGWETNYVGFPADVTMNGQGQPYWEGTTARTADLGLDTILETWEGRALIAPYVWNAKGQSLGRWPTNLSELSIPDKSADEGGPLGITRPSPDFTHLFISSSNVALAPGGLTTGVGSVYDNEIGSGEVTIASELPGGGDIQPEPGGLNSGHYLLLPSVSTDGSHVLMAAPAACTPLDTLEAPCSISPSRLYMRVGGEVTYDVSRGHQVNYVGMTADGQRAFFTSAEPLTGDDSDTSIDLFMWDGASDSLVRISAGSNPVGNTDGCNATWVGKCGIEVVPFNKGGHPGGNLVTGRSGFASDNSIAADNGAVYFYSPEQFVGSDGVPGRRNLYVSRNGQIQYVATFEASKPASRIQVSPDGLHAAFITDSQLTPQSNAGFDQMYIFDATTGVVRCASCNPAGSPPTADVIGSDNGLFMSDDGRVFFTTASAILPRDTNNGADVYEFVGSRPRLITTGAESPDPDRPTGLTGVSADGVDVYFSTLSSLVPTDQNGRFLKFYDARTAGGFPVSAQIAPCRAADECRAGGSGEVAPARVSSTAGLGSAGNLTPDRCGPLSQQARNASKQVRALRSHAKRATAGDRAAALRRKARDLEKKAKQAEARAKQCRATVSTGAKGGAVR